MTKLVVSLLVATGAAGALLGVALSSLIDYNVCSNRHNDCCYTLKPDALREPFHHARGPNCEDLPVVGY